MNSLLATLLSGTGTQFDYTYSLAVETGVIAQSDVDWNALSDWQRSTGGLRMGYKITPTIDLLGSVHWGTQSDSYNYYYDDYDVEYYDNGLSGYDSQVSETVVQLGPKFSWNLKPWFAPYATVQGLMIHNRLQMSDNGSFDEDATTLIDASAMGFGAAGALGLELRIRPIADKTQIFFYGEGGSAGTTALQFAMTDAGAGGTDINIGDLGYGGGYVRVGLGSKF